MLQSDRRRILISLLLAILAPFGLAAVASAEKPGHGADLEDVYFSYIFGTKASATV